jgi:hypothetical protein
MCLPAAARYAVLISGPKWGGTASGTSVPRDMEQTLVSLQDGRNGTRDRRIVAPTYFRAESTISLSRNHLADKVESFRIGDRGSDREDDLLSTSSATASHWLSGIAKASNSGGCPRHRQEHRSFEPPQAPPAS